jgi:hypothetical protein
VRIASMTESDGFCKRLARKSIHNRSVCNTCICVPRAQKAKRCPGGSACPEVRAMDLKRGSPDAIRLVLCGIVVKIDWL